METSGGEAALEESRTTVVVGKSSLFIPHRLQDSSSWVKGRQLAMFTYMKAQKIVKGRFCGDAISDTDLFG